MPPYAPHNLLTAVVTPLLAVLWLLLSAHGAGRAVAGRLLPADRTPLETALIRLAAGLGLLGMIFLLFGVAGHFTARFFAGLFAFTTFAGLALAFRASSRFCSAGPAVNRVFPPVLLVLGLPFLLVALYPPLEWDTTSYHLPLVRYFLEQQSVQPALQLRYPVLPHLVHVLQSPVVALSSDAAARLLNLAFAVLTALQVHAFARRHADAWTGWMAGGAFLSMPLLSWLCQATVVDLGITFFTCSALAWFINGVQARDTRWFIFAGLAAGLAAGCKYTGLSLIAFLALLSAIAAQGQRRRSLLAFMVPALLMAAPWYLYVAWHTGGNPVWPLAQQVFGYWYWEPSDLALQMYDFGRYGLDHTIKSFLQIPWKLCVDPQSFDAPAGFVQPVVLGLYILLPVIAFMRHATWVRWVAFFSFCSFITWYFTAQVQRYLLPMLPMLAIATAYVVRRALGVFGPLDRRAAQRGLHLLSFAILLIPGTHAAWKQVADYGALPVRADSIAAFVKHKWPNYDGVAALNRLMGRDARVFILYGQNLNYWVEGQALGDSIGPLKHTRVFDAMDQPEDRLVAELKAVGANALLLYVQGVPHEKWRNWPAWTRLRPAFGSEISTLFLLDDEPACRKQGAPVAEGRDLTSTAGAAVAVAAPAPVEGGQLYELQVEGAQHDAVIHLSVAWLDAEYARVDADAFKVNLRQDAGPVRYVVTAPPGARRAQVSFSAAGRKSVTLRRVVLAPSQYGACAETRP